MQSNWELTPAQVHIWNIHINWSDGEWSKWLSTYELEKAARFHFEQDRRRYIVAHSALRLLLSHHLGREPNEIEFNSGPHGKPEIAATQSSNLRFNLSHAGDLVLIALASERRVGVDVEFVRAIPDVEDIVRQVFSQKECAAFFALPGPLRQEAFFNGWTRKEAFVKALGAGLGYPLDTFDVSLGTKARIEIHNEPNHGVKWSLLSFTPAPNYAAALVVEGTGCMPEYHDWTCEAASLFV